MKDFNSNTLYKKLDDFIKKYYKNLILQGIFISLIILSFVFFIASISEYFLYFSVTTRIFLFSIIILTALYTLVYFILIPLFRLLNIKKRITYKQAVSIINNHFPEFKDTLLNSLELIQINDKDKLFSNKLLFASIQQRINNIKPYNFTFAINVKRRFFFLKILISFIIAALIFYLFFPIVLKQGATRIINYKTYYQKPLPFQLSILNKSLNVQKGSDYNLKVKVTGKAVPEELYVSFKGNRFFMKKNTNNLFSYNFKNVNNKINFKLTNEEFSSDIYQLKVLPVPVIINFKIFLKYPNYTNLKSRIIKNVGDFSIPAGTIVKFQINSVSTDSLFFTFNDSINHIASKNKNVFTLTKTFYKSKKYSISLKNKHAFKKNLISYSIEVIQDMYPNIKVASVIDSIDMNLYYFKGVVTDDYGFTDLQFKYILSDNNDSVYSFSLPINKNLTNQEFYYATDFSQLTKKSNKVNYYFLVTDNDKISGYKSTKSQVFQFIKPNSDSLQSLENKTNESIEDKLNQGILLSHELSEDIKQFQKQNINSRLTPWEKKKLLQNIVKKQNDLQKLVNQINKKNFNKNNFVNSFTQKSKDILKKQQEIDKLLKNLLSPEIKELMKQIAELQKKFNEKNFNQLSNQMKLSYDDLEKKLDKNLELLKKFEIEQKVDNTINNLQKLAKKQKELSQSTKHKTEENESLKNKQKEQFEQFKNIKKNYDEIKKSNSELENKFNLNDFKKQFDEINNKYQKSIDNLSNNRNRKAAQNQSENSQNLQNLSQSMQEMMMQNMQQQASVDIQNLRQILYNLLTFSFDQEDLINSLKTCRSNNPKFSSIVEKQNKLRENFVVINDSLFALSKRNIQLASIIDKDVFKINSNLERVMSKLEDRKTGSALTSQQFIMTSANNLTLFLSEALKSLQKMQSSGAMAGNKKCNKPGQGMPTISQMRKGQQSLKSQLQNMLNQMKKGNGSFDPNSMNKRLAKMLAQQEIFQQMLNQLTNNSTKELHKALQQINQNVQDNINDIINKNITPKTIKRQNMIISRLLKAENSDYERGIDKKRVAEEIKNSKISNPRKLFEYKRENVNFNEILQLQNLQLKSYYQKKYKKYLRELNNKKNE